MINYKEIIKSRKIRMIILDFFSFIPDKQMIQIQYWIKTGHKLNLKKPKRFTEKLQWYKLYYRKKIMRQCADKAEVRNYVEKCGYSDILIPLVGIYEDISDIHLDKLPNKFVAKDTLGGGGNAVYICKNKSDLGEKTSKETKQLFKQLREWINSDISYKHGGREWIYGGRRHRVIIERYLESNPETGGLIDYKFFCFNGRAEILYVIADRKPGEKVGLEIRSARTYKKLSAVRLDECPLKRKIPKPDQYEKMLQIAEKLSKPFPQVRIDLYCVEGHIYFGEMTFVDGSGYMKFEPDEFDFTLGDFFVLPNKR